MKGPIALRGGLHGAVIRDARGGVYRVFDPPAWRVDLWAWWFFFRPEVGKATFTVLGNPVEIRVYRVR